MSSDDAPPDDGDTSKPMREALSAALRRDADGDDGQRVQTLDLVVGKLITRALGGDISAIKEIFDRMDGKCASGAGMDDKPRQVMLEWKDSDDWSTTGPASIPPLPSTAAALRLHRDPPPRRQDRGLHPRAAARARCDARTCGRALPISRRS